jgi:hypothetical protein
MDNSAAATPASEDYDLGINTGGSAYHGHLGVSRYGWPYLGLTVYA